MAYFVDLDDILEQWTKTKYGQDFTLERIDTSKVEVHQQAVSYKSGHDWWKMVNYSDDYYDNNDSKPKVWTYAETVPFTSKATWMLRKGFKSSKYLPIEIDLQYPVAQEGKNPLQVGYSTNLLDRHQVTKTDSLQATWRLKKEATVGGYSSSCACAQIRICNLQNVAFATDVAISGTVKVSGTKKGKKWIKQDTSASIVDAFIGKEAMGFSIFENKTDTEVPARQVVFRFEGVCSGEVGVEAKVNISEITSQV